MQPSENQLYTSVKHYRLALHTGVNNDFYSSRKGGHVGLSFFCKVPFLSCDRRQYFNLGYAHSYV